MNTISFLNFTVFYRDRETGKIGACAVYKLSNDIEMSRHDLLCEWSDSDFEAVHVRFDGIESNFLLFTKEG